jgi:phosphoribosylaminoimidazolecarboxamide formyltransferase/IMP cyclohydrolase
LPERIARELRVRSALGGVLAEDDDPRATPERWRVVSARQPSESEWRDLRFAWDVVRHVKSNGVVVARDGITRGICAGQTNRVSAVRIAGERAGDYATGAACASDGFFPFADGLEAAVEAGCSAIIAPEGSIRDAEVIGAADRLGIALVFSSHRYFLH